VFPWTAKDLRMKGKRPCSAVEFYAYNGLELGMSLLKYDSIKSFWSKGCFIGHETFCDTMSRNRFESIRASARFTSFQTYDNEMAASDPLWSCRSFLDQIIRKSAAIAVPIGVSALDENRFVTKARSKAKTCSPNKPEKYAIHFMPLLVINTVTLAPCLTIMQEIPWEWKVCTITVVFFVPFLHIISK
jgi:hypothetical protein